MAANKKEDATEEIDEGLWFPTLVTEMTRQGYHEPIFSAVRALPDHERQTVLRELEQSIQKQIIKLTEDERKAIQTKMESPDKIHYITVEMQINEFVYVSYGYTTRPMTIWQEMYSDESAAARGLAKCLNVKTKYRFWGDDIFQPRTFTIEECLDLIRNSGQWIYDGCRKHKIKVSHMCVNHRCDCSFTSNASTSIQ